MSHFPKLPIADVVAEVKSGVSVNGLDRPAEETGLGVLKVSAVSKGNYLPTKNKAVVDDEIGRLSCRPRLGDVLVSRSNTFDLVGACGLVDVDRRNLFLPDKLWRLATVSETIVEGAWLTESLLTHPIRSACKRTATGTSGSMKNIAQRTFMRFKIDVPDVKVRIAIGSIAVAFRHLLGETIACLDLLHTRKAGLMREALSGRRRFQGFDEPLDEVSLSELFRERVDRDNCDLELLSVTAQDGIVSRDSLNRKDTSTEDKSNYKRILPGDIAYNTMRMWQGVSAMVVREGIVSPAYTVVTPKKQIRAEYAARLFKTPRVIHEFLRHSQGLVDDTLNLKFRHFSEVSVSIPSVEEQNRIVELLNLIDREIELLKRQRSAIEKQKRGVMERLLSGEVMIPDDVVERLNAEAEAESNLTHPGSPLPASGRGAGGEGPTRKPQPRGNP